MPRKKQTPSEEDVQIAEEAFARGAQLPVESRAGLCGHINKQFINSKGKKQDLACTLPAGHAGDHSAPYKHLVAEQGVKKDDRGNQVMFVSGYHEDTRTAYWSDAAGVPAAAQERTQEEDWQRLQKSRMRERGVDEDLSKRLDREVKGTFGG